ncbi:DUF72 domain-containing protein [Thermoplasma sp.]|uniref:DUF72 domain-containing protein n=1 Tax=Thermoplasma sp. TaxID=1973142 RepID=UPI002632E5E7|nr:DUF72 domain-containing protein [Thermoplasma sp.]
MQIRVGCSGWYYQHWRGTFYPEDLDKKEWFKYYMSKFDTVEINSSFYSFPDRKRVRSWEKQSSSDFIFSVKMNRSITHVKKLRDVEEDLTLFYEAIDALGRKLGCVLYQLPPSFKYSPENLILIESTLNKRFCNVVEFRNVTWFSESAMSQLQRTDIHIAAISSDRIPLWFKGDSIVYLRLHGDVNGYATDYPDDRLRAFAQKIVDMDPEVVYIYFNNDYNGYAPKNAITMKKILEGMV